MNCNSCHVRSVLGAVSPVMSCTRSLQALPGAFRDLAVPQRCRSKPRVNQRHLSCHAALSNRSMLYLSGTAGTDHSSGKAAESLKAQLHDLEDERKAATLKAETMATKVQRLGEAIENLQEGALRAMRQNDEAAARELLQEKTVVAAAMEKCKDRASVNFTLAEKLNKLIGAKQTELIAVLHQSGSLYRLPQKPFSVDPAGTVSMDGDDDSHPGSSRPEQQTSGGRGTTSSLSQQYSNPLLNSMDYQSDEDVNTKFLELERQTLESILQASRLESDQQASEALQHQQRQLSGSTASSSGASEEGRQSSSTWWHAADTYLQQAQKGIGHLESHQAQEMAKDVTTLLTRIVNARVMRGYDPTATQLVDLAVFQLGVKASADPAVRIAPPRTDFSINIRQRLFRDATAVALEACAQSAAGKQSPAWHELASNWAPKGESDAGACTPAVTGRLAQMFLRSLAELFKMERQDVERIVHAAVAAHIRARLLDAVAAVKQAEGASKAGVAVEQMRHLAAVVDTFPLPAGSAEMNLVYSGLAGFLGYRDRKTLHEAYQQVSSSYLSVSALAEALGMTM